MDKNEETAQTIAWLRETADQSKEFVIEQAPLYAQEVIQWAIWSNTITAIICAIIIAIAVATFKKVCEHTNEFDEFLTTLVCITYLCVVSATMLIGGCSLFKIVKAKTAPRMVIIEHFQKHIK